MKYAIFRALLNWNIDPERGARGLYYAGGELLTFDRARLFWMYRMSFDATISDADGFVPRRRSADEHHRNNPADTPVNLAPPMTAEQAAPADPAVYGTSVWGDGSESE